MIERVMVAPLNYSHRQAGMIDAFREVFGDGNVAEYDYMGKLRSGESNERNSSEFIRQALAFKPDWIWLQVQGSNILYAPAVFSAIKQQLPKTITTHWMGDARLEIPGDLAEFCVYTDATLISNDGQHDLYRRHGARRTHYVQIGLDFKEDVLGEPPWTPTFRVPDVVFCGGYYGSMFPGSDERIAAIRRLKAEGIDVGVVGSGWPSDIPIIGVCHVKQQHHVWKRAKVALSINHFNDIELYYSDRQLIAMASGTPVVCRYVPGLEREFDNHFHCHWFRNLDEMMYHVRLLLIDEDHIEQRKFIGQNGQNRVIRDHTWTARIRQLLPRVEAWRAEL